MIPAASQGGYLRVTEVDDSTWISSLNNDPDNPFPAIRRALICYTSGWHIMEGRVPEVVVLADDGKGCPVW